MAANDRQGDIAITLIDAWLVAGETLHAPFLAPYEVASAVTQLISSGLVPRDRLLATAERVWELPVMLHPLEDIPGVVEIALRLGRKSAYDAAYIALAQSLSAELWTFDGPLARNAAGLGFPVSLIVRS